MFSFSRPMPHRLKIQKQQGVDVVKLPNSELNLRSNEQQLDNPVPQIKSFTFRQIPSL